MDDRERIDSMIADYMALVEEGGSPDPAVLCAGRPDLLEQFLKDLAGYRASLSLMLPPAGSAATSKPVAGDDLTGNPRWKLGGLHVRGGLGEVHRARDVELDRPVAVKFIRSDKRMSPLQALATAARMKREADITSRLEHPGIVPVYGKGIDTAGRPYYVMRFIDGRRMRDAIDELHAGGLETVAFRRLLSQFATACRTVAFAHSRQVIHRDLKPDNIMLGEYGQVMVVDWGLARRLDAGGPEAADEVDEADLAADQAVRAEMASAAVPAGPGQAPNPAGDGPAAPSVDASVVAAPAGSPSPAASPDGASPIDATRLAGSEPAAAVPPPPTAALPAVTDSPEGTAADAMSAGRATITRTGQGMGTPGYIPPEQHAGHRHRVGIPADVYALGATLHHLLVGRAPKAQRDVQRPWILPDPPRTERPAVPAALDAICRKAMAVEPSARYASADELADDVDRWLADEAIRAPGEDLPSRMRRWARRRLAAVAALAATLMIAAGAVVVVSLLATKYERDRLEAERKSLASEEEGRRAQAAARENDTIARTERYGALLNACRERRVSREPGWTWRNLADLHLAAAIESPARKPEDLSAEYVSALTSPDVRTAGTRGFDFDVGKAEFSPDGKLLAVPQFRAVINPPKLPVLEVVLLSVPALTQERRLTAPCDLAWSISNGKPDGIRSLGWDAEGKRLAAGTRAGRLLIWDLTSPGDKPAAVSASRQPEQVGHLSFADRNHLVLMTGNFVKRVAVADFRETANFDNGGKPHGLRVDPLRGHVLVISGPCRLLDLATLAEVRRWEQHAISADLVPGGAIWVAAQGGQLHFLDAITCRPVRTIDAELRAESVMRPEGTGFLSGERLLMTVATDEREGLARVYEVASGRRLTSLHVPGFAEPRVTGRGALAVVAAGKHVTLFEAADRPEYRQTETEMFPVRDAVYGRDGVLNTLAAANALHIVPGHVARYAPGDVTATVRRLWATSQHGPQIGRIAVHPATGLPAYRFANGNISDWEGAIMTTAAVAPFPDGSFRFSDGNLLWGRADWTDVIIEADIEDLDGNSWLEVGVRQAAFDGCLLFRAFDKGRHRMLRVRSGAIEQVGEVASRERKPRFRIRVSAIGKRYECSIEGQTVIAGEEHLYGNGSVNLAVRPGSCIIRNLRVTTPDGKVLHQGVPPYRRDCAPVDDMAFAPDGALWAVLKGDTVVRWQDGKRGGPDAVWSPNNQGFTPPASNLRRVVAGKRHVYVGCRDGGLFVLNQDGKFVAHRTAKAMGTATPAGPGQDAGAVVGMALSDDERTLVLAGTEGEAWCVDLFSFRATPLVRFAGTRIAAMSLSGDKRTLVFATGDDLVRVFRLEGRTAEPVLTLRQPGGVQTVACSPDGRRLAIGLVGEHSMRVVDLAGLTAGRDGLLIAKPGAATVPTELLPLAAR